MRLQILRCKDSVLKSLSQSGLAERERGGCRSAEPRIDQNSSSPGKTYNRRGGRLRDGQDYGLISWAAQNICHHESKISTSENSSQSSKRMLRGGFFLWFLLCPICLICDSECGGFTSVPVRCGLLFHLPSFHFMSRLCYCCNVQYFLDILALLLIFISDYLDFQSLFLQ